VLILSHHGVTGQVVSTAADEQEAEPGEGEKENRDLTEAGYGTSRT
jgi:hypothetical protein